MELQLVSKEIASQLKELGFYIDTGGRFNIITDYQLRYH